MGCYRYSYCVQDRDTGAVLAEGTAKECASVLRVTPATVRKWATQYCPPKYQIVKLAGVDDDKLMKNSWCAAFAKKWDEACEPLRKKYGVEVKKYDG